MSKGIRINTLERVQQARERDPLSLGPFFGELAIRQQVSPSVLAELIGTHAQTVMRWMLGQSEIQAYWLPQVTRVLGLLTWRKVKNALPLAGTAEQQREQINQDVIDFKAAVKSSGRILTKSS